MIEIKTRKTKTGTCRVRVEKQKTYSKRNSKIKNEIEAKYSITQQLNIMRKAIISGTLTDIKKMDKVLNSIGKLNIKD